MPSPRSEALRRGALLAVAVLPAACAGRPPSPAVRIAAAVAGTSRAPPFAQSGFAPFSRVDAVAIALREWRLFGGVVDDDPPGSRPEMSPEAKPERMPGLWQRVGEYWWLGQDADRAEAGWTGRHDERGGAYDAERDADFAWSAAFISYVMRIAGAAGRFPYAAAHHIYIDVARVGGAALTAERLDGYAPVAGDLICLSRTKRPLRFDDLPAGPFPSHCDIVVGRDAAGLSVIGGNVADAVALKHVPVAADGRMTDPTGAVLDSRYPWFVALRVLYER